jgi:hypothetical protein
MVLAQCLFEFLGATSISIQNPGPGLVKDFELITQILGTFTPIMKSIIGLAILSDLECLPATSHAGHHRIVKFAMRNIGDWPKSNPASDLFECLNHCWNFISARHFAGNLFFSGTKQFAKPRERVVVGLLLTLFREFVHRLDEGLRIPKLREAPAGLPQFVISSIELTAQGLAH